MALSLKEFANLSERMGIELKINSEILFLKKLLIS